MSAAALATAFEIDWDAALARLPAYVEAGPRYTSYPTAPVWTDAYGPAAFEEDLAALATRQGEPLSLYVHVPFCRSLCHFCACNRVITQRPELPTRWLDAIRREIATLRSAIGTERPVSQLHWGGGTPTHLSVAQIESLHRALADAFPIRADAECSLEVDPRVTSEEQIERLAALGFRRLSLGVQDFDPRVQEAIHRVQSVADTASLVDRARRAGFAGISIDLIYGLPFQSEASMARTLDDVLAIAPDRVALYSYAHVTWVAKQQRGFERHDLPSAESRLRILVASIRRFLAAGYVYVGFDHFARPEDPLARALAEGTLRRNFMGYTTQAGVDLLGFGPSAISETREAYAQSARDLDAWSRAVEAGDLATLRGHRLGGEDRRRSWLIGRILCTGRVDPTEYRAYFGESFAERFAPELADLVPLARDGLVSIEADGGLALRPLGRLLARSVAMRFDSYLAPPRDGERPRFSQTV
jgi:oxygen-independent coproporphyrinogen-3 oxidase